MATANKDRQAAFKQKMRDAGMRQISIWLDEGQEQAVKAVLAGANPASGAESERLATWAEQLAQESHQLDTRWNELDALIAQTNLQRESLTKLQIALDEQEARLLARAERGDSLWQTHAALVYEIKELKRQMASARQQPKPARSFKVIELANRRDRIAEAMRVGSYSKTERRVDDLEQQIGLSRKFSAEIKGTNSRLHGFVDVAAGKKAVTHKRGWGAYSFDKSILTESEAELLLEACALLGRIENDVERAGSDITKLHAQRVTERKTHFANTESALNASLFKNLDRRGDILFIAAMNGSGRGFGKWADLLDKLNGKNTWQRNSADSLFREALAEEKSSLYRRIVDTLMAGEKKLDELVSGIVEKYRHPDTEEKYGALASKLAVLMVAEQIEKSSKP